MSRFNVFQNDDKHNNEDKREKSNSYKINFKHVSHSELNDTQSSDDESILSSTSTDDIINQSLLAPILAKLNAVEESVKELQNERKKSIELKESFDKYVGNSNRKLSIAEKKLETIKTRIDKNESYIRLPVMEIMFIILLAFLVTRMIYTNHSNDSEIKLNGTDAHNNESFFIQYENEFQKYEHELKTIKMEQQNTKQWQNIVEMKLHITNIELENTKYFQSELEKKHEINEYIINSINDQINTSIPVETNNYNQNTTAFTQFAHKANPILTIVVLSVVLIIIMLYLLSGDISSITMSVNLMNMKLENAERLSSITKSELDYTRQRLSARIESISDCPNNEVIQQLKQQCSILEQKNTELNTKNSNFENTLALIFSKVTGIESSFENMNSELEKTKSEIKQIESCQVVQCGTVAYFANKVAPNGWIKADGESVSRYIYSNLFAKIGTTFGLGNGSTTFTLPDLRGEFIRGWSDGRDVDKIRKFGSFQWGSSIPMAGHIDGHNGRAHSSAHHDRWGFAGKSFDDGFEINVASGELRNGVQYTSTKDETFVGYCDAKSNGHITSWNILKGTRPRNIALLACIKY